MAAISISGRLLLLVLYIASVVVTTGFFVKILERTDYTFEDYFHYLSVEAISWLPLIFSAVPAAALILQYNVVGFAGGIIYFALIFAIYWPRRREDRPAFWKRTRRIHLYIVGLWALLLLFCLFIKKPARTEILMATCIYFVAQPLLVVLAVFLEQPMEQLIEKRYLDEAGHVLEDRGENLTIVGIAGSYGKSEFRDILETLLQDDHKVLATPEDAKTARDIARCVRENLLPEHDVFLCEMQAEQVGDIREICSFVHPGIGVITALGYQHLETFRTVPNIIHTKYELLDEIDHLGGKGKSFVNGDSGMIREHPHELSGEKNASTPLTYGLGPDNDYCGIIESVTAKGTAFTLRTPQGESCMFHVGMIGNYNIVDIIGAAAIAHEMGISLADLAKRAKKLHGQLHRLELSAIGDTIVLDDTATTSPEGAHAAVGALSLFDGTKIVMTSGLHGLGALRERTNRNFGSELAAAADYLIVVGPNGYQIRAGAMEMGFMTSRIYMTETTTEAMKVLGTIAREDERVLLLESAMPGYAELLEEACSI